MFAEMLKSQVCSNSTISATIPSTSKVEHWHDNWILRLENERPRVWTMRRYKTTSYSIPSTQRDSTIIPNKKSNQYIYLDMLLISHLFLLRSKEEGSMSFIRNHFNYGRLKVPASISIYKVLSIIRATKIFCFKMIQSEVSSRVNDKSWNCRSIGILLVKLQIERLLVYCPSYVDSWNLNF
jgi:hypothetical protein